MKVIMDKTAPLDSSATASMQEADTDGNAFLNFMTANLTVNSKDQGEEVSIQNIENQIEEINQPKQEVTVLDQLLADIQQTNESKTNQKLAQVVETTVEKEEIIVSQEEIDSDVLPSKGKRLPVTPTSSTFPSTSSTSMRTAPTSPASENLQTQAALTSTPISTQEEQMVVNKKQDAIKLNVLNINNVDEVASLDDTQIEDKEKSTLKTQKLTSTPSANESNKNIGIEKIVEHGVQISAASVSSSKMLRYAANQVDVDALSPSSSNIQQAVPSETIINRVSTPTQMPSTTPAPANVNIRIDFIEQLKGKSLSQGVHQINIQITPPELGPVTAKLRIDNNKVDLEIMAKNSEVANIIRSQLSALREQFDDADIRLNSVSVQNSDQFQRRDDEKSQFDRQAAEQYPLNQSANQLKNKEKTKKVSDTLIDTYI